MLLRGCEVSRSLFGSRHTTVTFRSFSHMKKLVSVLTAVFFSVGFGGMVWAADAGAPAPAADAHHAACKQQATDAGLKGKKAEKFIEKCVKAPAKHKK